MSKIFHAFLWGSVFSLLFGFGAVTAQDEKTDSDGNMGLTAELSDATSLEAAPELTPLDENLFKYPEDAKPAELLAFVRELETKLPQPKNEEEMMRLIRKISTVYKEIAEKVLADPSAADEEKRQANELKIVAFTVGAQTGEEGAAEGLDQVIEGMLADAKDDQAKIQAYQMKLQSIAAGAQTDPSVLEKVGALADEILKNKDSEELQVFGLEVKAQEAFSKGRMDPAAIDSLVTFLDGYLADEGISQRGREKAQELKLASLLMKSQADETQIADFEKYFEEVLAGPLSPETRKAIYQMRIQTLMAGAQQGMAPDPENGEKLNALADRLMKEESEELQSLGFAVKSTSMMQSAQEDPSKIDALFEFADAQLAGTPSESLKKQMIGLKIQGYMLKVQQDPAAAKEMLAFLDRLIADEPSEEFKSQIATIKLQVLMMRLQEDISYVDDLEKALVELKDAEGMERLVQSGWGALYMSQIRNLAETGGSVADLDAILTEVKGKLNEMPILAFLLGSIKPNLDTIGKNNGDDKLTQRVYAEFIDLTKESENPTLKQVSTHLQTVLDLANLQGKGIQLEGIVVGDEKEKRLSSADMAGKYYLVDVWSTSDQSYFETLEELAALYQDFHPKGFEIVGVNTDEKTDVLGRTIDVLGMTWPVLSVTMSKEAGLEALPAELAELPPGTKVLVGPDGNVVVIDELPAIRSFLVEKLGEPEKKDADQEKAAPSGEEAESK